MFTVQHFPIFPGTWTFCPVTLSRRKNYSRFVDKETSSGTECPQVRGGQRPSQKLIHCHTPSPSRDGFCGFKTIPPTSNGNSLKGLQAQRGRLLDRSSSQGDTKSCNLCVHSDFPKLPPTFKFNTLPYQIMNPNKTRALMFYTLFEKRPYINHVRRTQSTHDFINQ